MKHPFDTFYEVDCHSRYNRLVRAHRDNQFWMLKGLKPEYADDAVMQELLRKEFDLGMMLRHSGVVAFVSMEQVPELDGTFIVQEWVDGVSLKQWLESPHNTREKIDLLRQLCDVLNYCHSMNVVHRDIKPSNIMVTNESQVVLIDFGLALSASQSIFRSPAGTDRYMAPEQRRDGANIDGRADLYAVGRIMQDMDLPRRYHLIADSLLATAPEQRPASTATLRQALDAVGRHRNQLAFWIVGLLATALLAIAAFFLGNGHLGSQLLGMGPVVAPLLPTYLTTDTTDYWSADTTHYSVLTTVDGAYYCVPKPGQRIAGDIAEDVAVDLGLSVLWAPFNVGCDRASLVMTGGFYGYGEPTGMVTTDVNTNVVLYWTNHLGDYSGTDYDIARQQWGGHWRSPRKADFDELIDRCQWTFVRPAHGPAGYLVVGPNGNRIFLPLSGFRYGLDYYEIGEMGFYWTANPTITESDSHGLALRLSPEGMLYLSTVANNGFSVRPVLDR